MGLLDKIKLLEEYYEIMVKQGSKSEPTRSPSIQVFGYELTIHNFLIRENKNEKFKNW